MEYPGPSSLLCEWRPLLFLLMQAFPHLIFTMTALESVHFEAPPAKHCSMTVASFSSAVSCFAACVATVLEQLRHQYHNGATFSCFESFQKTGLKLQCACRGIMKQTLVSPWGFTEPFSGRVLASCVTCSTKDAQAPNAPVLKSPAGMSWCAGFSSGEGEELY